MAIVKTFWINEIEEVLEREVQIIGVAKTYTEDQVKGGASIKVKSFDEDVDVLDYTGADIASQNLQGNEKTLLIDKAKYFNITMKDLDAVQGDPEALSQYVIAAVKKVKRQIESDIYAKGIAKVDAGNVIDKSGVKATVDTIISYLEDINVALDDVDAKDDRFVVLDTKSASLLRQAGYLSTSTIESNSSFGAVKTEMYGDRLRVITSTVVKPVSDVITILAGTVNDFLKYAGQLEEIEGYRVEKNFKDAVKGLYVYGTDVFNGKKGAKLLIKDYNAA